MASAAIKHQAVPAVAGLETISGDGNAQTAFQRQNELNDERAQGNPGPAPLARPSTASFFPDARVIIPGDMEIKAFALFGNLTFDVTDAFRVKLGARYLDESRDIVVNTFLPGAGPGLHRQPGQTRAASPTSTRKSD